MIFTGQLLFSLLTVALFIFPGCAMNRGSSMSAVPPPGMPAPSGRSLGDVDKSTRNTADEREEQSPVTTTEQSKKYEGPRMIIYTGRINMEVNDVEAAAKRLADMVKESHGYYITSSISKSGESGKSGTFTIKIPADILTSFTDKISQLGEVTGQSQSGQDVTEEFVDQSARLHNMVLEEKKYQDMYDRAKNVDDMLKVRKELGRVRGDIEALQGRLNYMKNNVAMATVDLSLVEHSRSMPHSFWNLKGTVGDAFRALIFMVKLCIVLIIYILIVCLPFVVVIVLIAKAIRAAGKGRAQSPKQGQAPGTQEPPPAH
jgi:hypothetical protein